MLVSRNTTSCRGAPARTTGRSRALAREKVLVLPGQVVELPGYFRILLTATDEMVERSLPVFERAIQR